MNKNVKLAQILTDYSIKVKTDENILISCSTGGLPLARQIYKLCLEKGAYPQLNLSPENWDYLFYTTALKKHLTHKPEISLFLAKWADKFIRIVSETNSRQLANIDPKKVLARIKASEPVRKIMLQKPWILTYYPTASLAQAAGMSEEELVKVYFDACLQDWPAMAKKLRKLKSRFDKTNRVQIKGLKTNLAFSLKGRLAEAAAGEHNMPDGEVFACPLEKSVEGKVYFDLPSLYQGKIVEGVSLEFKKGRVITALAKRGNEVLQKALKTDAGAKRFGEFAIGTNYGIKKPMLNTLFDEKIGGTIHLALGNAYPDKEGGGKNRSAIHWDLVKDTRLKDSLVLFDGTPVLKSGQILV